MKRFIAMLLILCSALLMTAAFAEEAAPEAKITVVEQRFINMEDNGRGFFFAKVQNTGDAAGSERSRSSGFRWTGTSGSIPWCI